MAENFSGSSSESGLPIALISSVYSVEINSLLLFNLYIVLEMVVPSYFLTFSYFSFSLPFEEQYILEISVRKLSSVPFGDKVISLPQYEVSFFFEFFIFRSCNDQASQVVTFLNTLFNLSIDI